MPVETECALCYVRPDSRQLFFLFTGVAEVLNIHPLEFIQKTGIGGRNIVIFRDPYRCSYQKGISVEYDSYDAIVRWQKERLAERFSHVSEIFCAGTSGGGPPAVYTADELGARAAWSLGGRIAKEGHITKRDRARREFYTRIIGRPNPGRLTAGEVDLLVRAFETPEGERLRWELAENPETVVDSEQSDRLADRIRSSSGRTDFHFYYATTNQIDREFGERFRGVPRATLYPIVPPPEDNRISLVFSKTDHGVVPMLEMTGQLASVFADYL